VPGREEVVKAGDGADAKRGSAAKLALLGAGALVGAAGVAMFFAPSLYEVVDQGRDLRPYESGEIYEIRVADSVTVYAAEESRPDTDAISGSALVALATASLMTFLLLAATGAAMRLRAFYAVAAAGFAFLALDELFAVHETVGHNLLFLSDLPGIERPDDAIFALYVIPAVAFLLYFRDILTGSRRAVWLFAAAIGVFLLAGLSDVAGVGTDELLEVVSAGFIVGGFVTLIVAHLSSMLGLGGGPGDDGDGSGRTDASARVVLTH
jgi:hypothetical protein